MKSITLAIASSISVASALAAAVVLAGCGGATSNGIAGGIGGKGAVVNTTAAGMLSPNQRQVTISAASTALSAVPTNASGLQDPQAIAAALKSIRGVLNATAQSNGSVTAQFSDGLPFTIFNDRPTSVASKAVKIQAPVDSRSAAMLAQTRTVPAGGNISLQNALNSTYNSLNTSKATTAFASSDDYKPPIVGTSTVAELRAVGSTQLGILYLTAHGGTIEYTPNPPSGTETSLGYGISTSTQWSTATAASYAADYADHSLGLGYADNVWYYCITANFISKYKWSFAKDSFVVLDTCSGGKLDSADSGTFRQALFTAGASVVAAWPTVEAYGGNATDFLIDRMLGTNVILPITNPPMRPLSLSDSIALLNTYSTLNGEPVDKPETFLNPATSGQQFTALVPTISSESITGTTLTLTGEFGVPSSTNTSVSVGGKLATNVAVTSAGLTCTLPANLTGHLNIYADVTTPDGRTLKSNIVGLTIVTGRWDAVMTTGNTASDVGLLITSETESAITGTATGVPFTGAISGDIVTFSFAFQDQPQHVLSVSASASNTVMSGTVTATWKGTSAPISFLLKSSTPVTPYTGSPKVVSSAIIWMSGINEYALRVAWDRPADMDYLFNIVQGAKTIYYPSGDGTHTTYDSATFTYTVPLLASAGLAAGSCTLSLCEPGYAGGTVGAWYDAYGALAWTTPSQVYSANLVVPKE